MLFQFCAPSCLLGRDRLFPTLLPVVARIWTGGIIYTLEMGRGFPCGSAGKESACNARDLGSVPGSGRSHGEGNGNPLQFLPGEAQGQRSLVGYSPWGCKELDTIEEVTNT